MRVGTLITKYKLEYIKLRKLSVTIYKFFEKIEVKEEAFTQYANIGIISI